MFPNSNKRPNQSDSQAPPGKKRYYNNGKGGGGGGGGAGGGRPAYQPSFQKSVPQLPSCPEDLPQRSRNHQNTRIPCPYGDAWSVYFPDEPFTPNHDLIPLIETFRAYFDSTYGNRRDDPESALSVDVAVVVVDYIHLKQSTNIEDLPERLRNQPNDVIASLELAACLCSEDDGTVADTSLRPKKIVRLVRYDILTPLKELKANLMGHFLSVRGTVVRVSSIKPIVTKMLFTCNNCGAGLTLAMQDGKFKAPARCSEDGCKGKAFTPARGANASTTTVDWQKIRLQEKLADDQVDSGRIPRTVECELTDDLVDLIAPGDVVCVTGIVKVLATDEGKGKNKGTQMYYLYLSVNSLVKASSSSSQEISGAEEGGSEAAFTKDFVQFSRKDLYGIKQIHEEGDDVFRLLVNSLCPAIFGHELVKAGLLLTLIGGRRHDGDESKEIAVRSNPHILVVGDPGLGKSQMLAATVKAAPRGVYICGNTTTASGLTVTLCKDAETGETGIEAGALVLGDRGICCIDEFDKLTEHQALLEAMEQQSVSIAKAGIVYNSKAKTVSENLRMNTALLSRFDLVFILLDKPDEEMDMFLSDHIMKLHSGGLNYKNKGPAQKWGRRNNADDFDEEGESVSLADRLKVKRGEQLDPIPLSLLRKYIAYSRKYVQPKLDHEAALLLQEFYLTLRSKYRSVDATPITTRQLESMVRLTEARARSELRDVATKADAEDIVALMKFSLWETYEDNTGAVDFQRSQNGTGMSKKGEPKRFVAQLSRVARDLGNDKFNIEQLQQIANGTGETFVRTMRMLY
ncbi:DNA replication licensing factor mcm8 [Chytridiales sp. JEL 0842]|nr:DNA replication licensing factor mcm8 [Chytridiales sp. JEL 0842]